MKYNVKFQVQNIVVFVRNIQRLNSHLISIFLARLRTLSLVIENDFFQPIIIQLS